MQETIEVIPEQFGIMVVEKSSLMPRLEPLDMVVADSRKSCLSGLVVVSDLDSNLHIMRAIPSSSGQQVQSASGKAYALKDCELLVIGTVVEARIKCFDTVATDKEAQKKPSISPPSKR